MDFSINNSAFNKRDLSTWKEKETERDREALIAFHFDFASDLIKKSDELAKKIIS